MRKLKDIGELKLIEKFRAKYKIAKHTIIGIGDDSAVIKIPNKKKLLLFTCDTLVEGIHFQKEEATGYQIGWKLLGAGLSDIAAMGGIPISAIISLGLSPGTKIIFVDDLIRGINSLANRFRMDIVGGDTVSSPKAVVISVAVIGAVSKKNLMLRSGAMAGDKILVTGRLGGSRFGKQFNFIPRIKEAQWLVSHAKVNAMMDITDGLSIDLYKLITASKVGALIYKEKIPISNDAYRTPDPLKSALSDGEDFELIITTAYAERLLKKWKNPKVPLTIIGEITKEKGEMRIMDKNGRIEDLIPQGYEHFK